MFKHHLLYMLSNALLDLNLPVPHGVCGLIAMCCILTFVHVRAGEAEVSTHRLIADLAHPSPCAAQPFFQDVAIAFGQARE